MARATSFLVAAFFLVCGSFAQSTELVFNPARTGELTDLFPVGEHNGARGLSGPWDLDRDGKYEILVAQHDAAGGRVHVIESSGVDTWELVYSTAFIDSSSSSSNSRYATGTDLDGDGNWEITFIAGTGYDTNNNAFFKIGAYVYEHDGVVGSDNYGTFPATIGNYYELDANGATFGRAQNLEASDVDGDGRQELLVPSDGSNDLDGGDIFYVLSVDGSFEPNGAGMGFETWEIESRLGPRENGGKFGGGSPYELIAADLDGDGTTELSYHTWNSMNFFNATVTGPDTYVFADTSGGAPDPFYKATGPDDVALFGGVAADLDDDGNDEVFYANFFTGNVTVVDYDQTDDVLSVGPANVFGELIRFGTGHAGGTAVGDINGDGRLDVLIGGSGQSSGDFRNGVPPHFVAVALYQGGSPSDAANYVIQEFATPSPEADTSGFELVTRDSAGVITQYYQTGANKQGGYFSDGDSDPVFTSGIAFMGDADGDGDVEIALSFQGVDDSLRTWSEVFNPATNLYDRTVTSSAETPVRAFVRVVGINPTAVSIEDERLVLPSDYRLHAAYPNPFNPSTTIRFELPVEKRISLEVYDVSGRLVRRLVQDQLLARGTHEVTWDGTNGAGVTVASGTYIYSLRYGNFQQSRKVTMVK